PCGRRTPRSARGSRWTGSASMDHRQRQRLLWKLRAVVARLAEELPARARPVRVDPAQAVVFELIAAMQQADGLVRADRLEQSQLAVQLDRDVVAVDVRHCQTPE